MIYILASKSLTILSLLSTALLVVDIGDDDDDVSTLSSSESVGSDPVAVWEINCYIIFNNFSYDISNVASTCVFYKTIFCQQKLKSEMELLPHLDRLFKFTDKCQNCCNNGIKKSDLFLETGFLSDRTGDRVRSGSNGVAERGNLGVCLALPSLLGKLCVCFDHISTGTWIGDVTALPEKRPVELIFQKVLSPTYRDDPASLALFSFAFFTASAFFFAWRK